MGIQIGAKPDSSFENPLGLLSDCHRRIERFLQSMIDLVDQVQEVGETSLNDNQRHALEVALKYFREAAPRHTRDEEESLFPKLRASNDPNAISVMATIDALESDHDQADKDHADADRISTHWLSDGASLADLDELKTILTRLQTLYKHHIAVEDTQLFPLAAQMLDEAAIKEVGREMAERRGINLDSITDMKLRCPTKRDQVKPT